MRLGRWCITAVVGVLGVAVIAEPAEAQVQFTSTATEINVTGRVQIQYNHTSVDSSDVRTLFFVRRARLSAEITVDDFVYGRIQPEYGEGIVGLRDAFVRLNFHPGFRTTAGQFKRPFDVFELVSSTQIHVIERAGGVRDVGPCSGVDGICSFSRFTEKLNYSDRDIGFMVDGSVGGFRYSASVTNGRGPNNRIDENTTKSYTGRVEYALPAGGRVGAHVAAHDFPNAETNKDEYAVAYGADIDWGRYEQPGLHVKAGVVLGDNWKNLVASEPAKFLAMQGIVTYLVPVENSRRLTGIEPIGRVSWGDPDTDIDSDHGLLFTPGLVFHFTGRNKFAINTDIWSPAGGDTAWSLKMQMYLYF